MLYAFIAGFGLLVALLMMANWLANAEPKAILRGAKWAVFGVLGGAFVFLLATGRLGWAFAALVAMAPWAGRILRALMAGMMARQLFGGAGSPFGGLGGSGDRSSGRTHRGRTSTVSSRYLEMALHHASGRMVGRVREGPFAGRTLDELGPADRLALWRSVQNDADSLRLLEAWLDRNHPDWRTAFADSAGGRSGSSSEGGNASSGRTMDRQEALLVLGLEEGASQEEIRAAYRRLMAHAHPDRGGSTWLAAKLNEAKAVLLDKGR